MTSKEKANARSRAWYHANRERCLARNKAWDSAHPERRRERNRLSKARRRAVDPETARAKHREWSRANISRTKRWNQIARWRQYAHLLTVKQDMGGMCVNCGLDDPLVLDFDHRLPAQKRALVSQLSSLESMRREASKCDLRCANCHRRKTYYSGDLRPH